jgi:hypothetical protein
VKVIVLGTDHCLQPDDSDLKKRVQEVIRSEQVVLIGEEISPESRGVVRQVAEANRIRWIPIDMSTAEKIEAGIYDKLSDRMQESYPHGLPILRNRYAPREDGIREEFWLDKIEKVGTDGAALIVCGCSHVRPLSDKAENRGHRVTRLWYPEDLSQLEFETF